MEEEAMAPPSPSCTSVSPATVGVVGRRRLPERFVEQQPRAEWGARTELPDSQALLVIGEGPLSDGRSSSDDGAGVGDAAIRLARPWQENRVVLERLDSACSTVWRCAS